MKRLTFSFSYSLSNAYLNVVLLFNLLFGVAAGFLASVFIIISNKSQINNLQNKNKILMDELNDLRNVAIDEGIMSPLARRTINIGSNLYFNFNCYTIDYCHLNLFLLLKTI